MVVTRRGLAVGFLAGGSLAAMGPQALAAAKAATGGKPKFGAFGLDLTAIDHAVQPGDEVMSGSFVPISSRAGHPLPESWRA